MACKTNCGSQFPDLEFFYFLFNFLFNFFLANLVQVIAIITDLEFFYFIFYFFLANQIQVIAIIIEGFAKTRNVVFNTLFVA